MITIMLAAISQTDSGVSEGFKEVTQTYVSILT